MLWLRLLLPSDKEHSLRKKKKGGKSKAWCILLVTIIHLLIFIKYWTLSVFQTSFTAKTQPQRVLSSQIYLSIKSWCGFILWLSQPKNAEIHSYKNKRGKKKPDKKNNLIFFSLLLQYRRGTRHNVHGLTCPKFY